MREHIAVVLWQITTVVLRQALVLPHLLKHYRQNEGLPQNDSGDLPPKRLRCALSSQTPLADELMRTLADDDQEENQD